MRRRDECVICEGRLTYDTKVIEIRGERYCEACYEDVTKEEDY
ncbi:hypothetical protein 015DV002_246 [Bacillus phage 015DV002]|nr:hypothetical protein 015DV002_246 [Bacillus phage 015DV002]